MPPVSSIELNTQGVYAVSKCNGIVLSVGHSIQDKFSGQLADTAPISHIIDGQLSYPIAPRLEKAGTVHHIFSC